jgi:hypothetical protein
MVYRQTMIVTDAEKKKHSKSASAGTADEVHNIICSDGRSSSLPLTHVRRFKTRIRWRAMVAAIQALVIR